MRRASGDCRQCHGQQRRQARAVIGDAGSTQAAIRIDADLVACFRRNHGIEVRRESDQRTFGARLEERQHVAGAIDLRLAAVGAELRRHPLRAPMLDKGGRGYAA